MNHKSFRIPTLIIGFIAVVFILRWKFPERNLEYTGIQALFDSFFAFVLLGLTLLVASGLGLKIQRWLKISHDYTSLEQIVFGVTNGLGILAYGVFLLGISGLLTPVWILTWLGLALIIACPEWTDILEHLFSRLRSKSLSWKAYPTHIKLLLIFSGLFLALALPLALSPPTDYDALMYHLQVPRLLLQSKQIILLPEIGQANGPSMIEMLYMIGMAFGTATFSKLISLSFAVILLLAIAAFGNLHLDKNLGWIAVAVMLGIPIFPVWATMANTDMGWAVYEFLALYALIQFQETGKKSWVILAGLQMGFALGSKYLALGGLGVLTLCFLWRSSRRNLRHGLRVTIGFCVIAGFVGFPWYIKNIILSGNPFYPFLFGGPAWDAERLALLMQYVYSFGTHKTISDYFLLPFRLYSNHLLFATYMTRIEFPSILFPFTLLYPLFRGIRVWDTIAVVTGLRFIVWALGSQQTRFLLPLFPSLSLVTVFVFYRLGKQVRVPTIRRVLSFGLIGSMVVTSLIYQFILIESVSPLAVMFGKESKESFLRRTLYDYPALEFAQQNTAEEARILMMWDGQGFYCDERCLPDPDMTQWTLIASRDDGRSSIANALEKRGVTHTLISLEGLNFILQHDPMDQHNAAAQYYFQQFREACTEEVYRDQYMIIDAITCNK
jgi:hypothetical protein